MNTPLSFLFNEIVWTMNKHADKMLKDHFDITFKQFLLLATLARAQPTTQHNLARCLEYSDAAVSRMANKLADVNYVLIKKDPTHGKKNVLTLSDTGLTIVASASQILEEAFLPSVSDAGLRSSDLSMQLAKLNETLKEKQI